MGGMTAPVLGSGAWPPWMARVARASEAAPASSWGLGSDMENPLEIDREF
jgi:hypothetical protein